MDIPTIGGISSWPTGAFRAMPVTLIRFPSSLRRLTKYLCTEVSCSVRSGYFSDSMRSFSSWAASPHSCHRSRSVESVAFTIIGSNHLSQASSFSSPSPTTCCKKCVIFCCNSGGKMRSSRIEYRRIRSLMSGIEDALVVVRRSMSSAYSVA